MLRYDGSHSIVIGRGTMVLWSDFLFLHTYSSMFPRHPSRLHQKPGRDFGRHMWMGIATKAAL